MKSRKLPVVALALLGAAGLGSAVALGCGGDDDAGPAAAADASAEAAPGTDAAADGDTGVVPKGARTLGFAMIVGDVDFADNVQRAVESGATASNLTLAWDQIERLGDAGADGGDAEDAGAPVTRFNSDLHVANLLFSENDVQEVLALPVLDVGGPRLPSDLAGRALDDEALGARYEKLTDYALDSSQDVEIPALFVATDVDRALGDDAAKIAAFTTLLTRAAAHVHAVRPKIKVGFTVSADGITAAAPRLAAAWAASDVVGVSVMPGLVDGKVARPADVGAAFDALVAAAPAGKPILVHQIGSPSGASCGSDETQQAALVTATFQAWDRHADRIGLLTVWEMADPDVDVLTARAVRYGRAEPGFVGYLGSMGLRNADHRDKQGFAALGREARARGF